MIYLGGLKCGGEGKEEGGRVPLIEMGMMGQRSD